MEVDHDHGLTEFEKERLRRVQRNRQALVELGVQNAIDKLSAQRSQDAGDAKSSNRKRKDRNMEPTPPARRSLRQQGVKLEELAGPSSTAAGELAEPRRGYRPSSSKPVTSEGRSVEAHNLHRIRTMSDDALRLRIMRITNVVKMENFVHVLRDQGMHELAGEAQQALDELRGGDSSSGGPGA